MSNEQAKQADASKSASYPLIGKEHFTEEERAAFLRQARLEEANYDPIKYMTESEIRKEHIFANPNHPVYLKNYMDIDTRHMQVLTEALANPSLGDLEKGKAFMEQQRSLFEKQLSLAQIRLDNNQAALETYYQDNPHKRPDLKNNVSAEVPQESAASKQGQGWHKARVDASQPLQFTESFRRTAEIGRDPTTASKAAEFKPQVASPDARALYTHQGETDTNIAWHQKSQNFSYQQPVSGESLKRAGKLGLIAVGLTAAVETANATPGTLPEKFDAAGKVLKDMAIDAVPGVTYLQKMQAGKYQEAALDASSYLPLGDIAGIARSPEVQAVIDALPKSANAIEVMMNNKAEAPINRHLAECQLMLMQAKNEGDIFKGLSFSSRLTDLAEKKVILQVEWEKNSATFSAAVSDPQTEWVQVKKNNPEIASYVDIHLAAVNSGRPSAFVAQMDANLIANVAKGSVPVLPEISVQKTQQVQEEMSLIK